MQMTEGGFTQMHHMNGVFGSGMGTMMSGGFFWIVLAIVFLYLLVKKSARNTGHNRQAVEKSAIDILNEEYAKGNISEREYARKKNNLMQ